MSTRRHHQQRCDIASDAIARRAFEKWAARRAEGSGSDSVQDWLEAEAEVRERHLLNRQVEVSQRRIDRLLSATRREHLSLATEHDITRILSMSSTLSEAAPQVLQRLCEHFGYAVGVLWRVDESADLLRCADVFAAPTYEASEFVQAMRRQSFAIGAGVPGHVWATESCLSIPRMARELSPPRNAAASAVGLHGELAFPVRNGTEFLGVLEFFARKVRKPSRANFALMSSIGHQIGQFIERINAEGALHRLREERRIAGDIQQRLLPRSDPVLEGYEIRGRCRSTTDVGGDCFDFIPSSYDGDESLDVLVADASGHGIGAALIMAEARAYIDALSLTCHDLGHLLSLVNRRLAIHPDFGGFITAFLLRLRPRSGVLAYASAGHCPGIVFDGQGLIRERLFSTSLPLGISTTDLSASSTAHLEPGELLLLYSDGATEVFSPSGELFGTQRLCASVRTHWEASADELLERVIDDIVCFSDGLGLRDDLTLVVIKRLPPGPHEAAQRPARRDVAHVSPAVAHPGRQLTG